MARIWAMDWQANTLYTVDDQVYVSDSKLYRCITEHTSWATFSATDWRLVVNAFSNMYNTYIYNPDEYTPSQFFAYIASVMTWPSKIQLDAGEFPITDTMTINMPHPLFIEWASANTTKFYAHTGLANKPMFDLKSNVWFDKFSIDWTTLAGRWANNTENVFDITVDGLYLEWKDFIIKKGYHAVNLTWASKIFFLDRVIEETEDYAININSTGVVGLDSEIGTISNCKGWYKLANATGSDIIVDWVIFDWITEYWIDYDWANFVSDRMEIKWCWYDYSWHWFTHWFNFTLQRDANIEMISNIWDADKKPMARINLVESTATQWLTSNTWTKINFANTNSAGQKFTIANNRITFQSDNPKHLMFWVSGNMQATTATSNLNVAIVKNGNTALWLFGNQSLYIDVSNRNFAFSLNTMIENIVKDDYFEVRCQPVWANETIRLVDINILCDSR